MNNLYFIKLNPNGKNDPQGEKWSSISRGKIILEGKKLFSRGKNDSRGEKMILSFHLLWTEKNGRTNTCKDKEKRWTFEGEISRIDTHLRKNITTKKISNVK